jgi:hypothetical protein
MVLVVPSGAVLTVLTVKVTELSGSRLTLSTLRSTPVEESKLAVLLPAPVMVAVPPSSCRRKLKLNCGAVGIWLF